MSSMTAKEESEYHFLCEMEIVEVIDIERECFFVWHDTIKSIDWLNAHHFDYRGLIEKNLAIEAPEGMYKS